MSTSNSRRWRRANGVKRVDANALAVSRAVLRALGFDPDTHDINPTRGGGVRIDKGGEVVKRLTKAELDAELADERTTIAIQTFLPRERAHVAKTLEQKANETPVIADAPPAEPAA